MRINEGWSNSESLKSRYPDSVLQWRLSIRTAIYHKFEYKVRSCVWIFIRLLIITVASLNRSIVQIPKLDLR